MANASTYTGPERRQRVPLAFLDRLQASNVPGRIFLFFLAAHTAFLTYVPGTLTDRVFGDGDRFSWLIILIATIGMIDTFINDMLPDRFKFHTALRLRHITLMVCAGFFLTAAFLASQMEPAWPAIPYYVACSLVVTMHAVFDVRRRIQRRN